jgi:aubergine-like protein
MENPEFTQLSKVDFKNTKNGEFLFPTKPSFKKQGQPVAISTNYFKFEFLDSNVKTYFKYAVEFEPELPGDALKLRRQIYGSARAKIDSQLGYTIFNNTTAYAKENVNDPIEVVTTCRDQTYKIKINWANAVDCNSFEALGLYRRFFNSLVKSLNFMEMKRNHFNPKHAKVISEFNIELWPGFSPTINILENGILLNLSVVHRVLRNETALDMIKSIQKNFRSDNNEYRQSLEETLKGACVITRYSKEKTYVVSGIEFNKNPSSTFETKNGEISFYQYYKDKYGKTVSTEQPLLIVQDRKTEQIIYLVPELCYMSGLTDNMRSNFNLMKTLADHTKGSAKDKVNENIKLINNILADENCKKEIEKWGISISNQPMLMEGRKISAGNLLMSKKGNNRVEIPIDGAGDLDRQVQQEMFSNVPIDNWAVK